MLASRHDQENMVHGHHQVPAKQQPKTPGARYPKTPLGFRNNENAPTAFAGKTAMVGGGSAKLAGGNDWLVSKGTAGKGQTMVTPLESRARAPLGNKTTNAKARTGRSVGVKDMVKEIERSQTKQATVQRSRQHKKAVDHAPTKLAIKPDNDKASDDGEEPEYAPPQPTPLPYVSDVLPESGLTFEGLKKHNFLKGFYEHFHNPIDENGVSREEKRFQEEMETVLTKAEERNERQAAGLSWNMDDIAETVPAVCRKPQSAAEPESYLDRTAKGPSRKQVPTMTSKRAASALAIPFEGQKTAVARPTRPSSNTSARRPLSALMSGSKSSARSMDTASSTGNSAGEAASRTTIGYNMGRTASSMVRSRGGGLHQRPVNKAPGNHDTQDLIRELTGTPARVRQAAEEGDESVSEPLPRPQFLSIFDEEELPPMRGPSPGSDDEDEFELKLTM